MYDLDLDFKYLFKCIIKYLKHQEPPFAFFTIVFVLVFMSFVNQDYVIYLSSCSMTLCVAVVFSLLICYYNMNFMLF